MINQSTKPYDHDQPITRFGPVGMAQELHQPAITLHISTIEPSSPAESAGLQKGQISPLFS